MWRWRQGDMAGDYDESRPGDCSGDSGDGILYAFFALSAVWTVCACLIEIFG